MADIIICALDQKNQQNVQIRLTLVDCRDRIVTYFKRDDGNKYIPMFLLQRTAGGCKAVKSAAWNTFRSGPEERHYKCHSKRERVRPIKRREIV